MTSPRCSIVIPVHNQAALTSQCLDALVNEPPAVPFEVIVVDDASTDSTGDLLGRYGDTIRVVSRGSNSGFAAACNDGARAAAGDYLVFLNNDTIPTKGWLDRLSDYADDHARAAVVGAKLLFPNDTVQHAGVVICQDGLPRHLYVGFPADHPAVNKSRRFQAVTAACALVRRGAFDQVDGFDTAFRNSLEDADLCLRLGERLHEVHYCHESVLYHLESISRGKRSDETEQNIRLFRSRWDDRVKPDELDYYKEDGLLRIHYQDGYPLRMQVSPRVATVASGPRRDESAQQLLDASSRQVVDLLRETVRLTARIAELELGQTSPESSSDAITGPRTGHEGQGTSGEATTHSDLLRRARELELEILDFQAEVSATVRDNGVEAGDREGFRPGEYLRYRRLLGGLRELARTELPAGATVLVISKGDDELLDLGVERAWHFPQDEHGCYAGHYPESGADAIAQLEGLRAKGAQYLVIPAMASWWLDHYPEFGAHLRASYPLVADDRETCLIFALAPEPAAQ
jgi:GT2 family glycosyltransferase